VQGAGRDGETRELLVVRPQVIKAGTSYTAPGQIRFDFQAPHPLHQLGNIVVDIEVAVDFELVVGAEVTVERPELLNPKQR
jgi:hypothetical protein